jgi:hypothetical protein
VRPPGSSLARVGQGGVVPSSRRRVLMNVSVRSRVPPSAGRRIAV